MNTKISNFKQEKENILQWSSAERTNQKKKNQTTKHD